MEIVINKKDLKFLPSENLGIKIETVSEVSAVITATVSNSMNKIRYKIPCSVIKSGRVFFKTAKLFHLMADDITIKNTTRSILISSSSNKATFKEPCIFGEDIFFPDKNGKGNKVDRENFYKALKVLCPSTHGYLLDFDNDKINIVATDNVQFTVVSLKAEGITTTFKQVVTGDSIKALCSFLKEVPDRDIEIINLDSVILVEGDGWQYCLPCLNTIFTDYQKLINTLTLKGKRIVFNTDILTFGLECSLIKSKVVVFKNEHDGLYISSQSQEGGGGFGPFKVSDEVMPMKIIKLNAQNLLYGIQKYNILSAGQPVPITFHTEMSPVYINANDYLYILAPLIQ